MAACEEWRRRRRRLTGYYSSQLKPQTGWKRDEFLQLSVSSMQKYLHTFSARLFRTRNGDWLVCCDSTGNPMGNNPDPLSLPAHPLAALTEHPPYHWGPECYSQSKVHRAGGYQQPKWRQKKFLGDCPRPQQVTQDPRIHSWILCVLLK